MASELSVDRMIPVGLVVFGFGGVRSIQGARRPQLQGEETILAMVAIEGVKTLTRVWLGIFSLVRLFPGRLFGGNEGFRNISKFEDIQNIIFVSRRFEDSRNIFLVSRFRSEVGLIHDEFTLGWRWLTFFAGTVDTVTLQQVSREILDAEKPENSSKAKSPLARAKPADEEVNDCENGSQEQCGETYYVR
jgi:hypothetical protein